MCCSFWRRPSRTRCRRRSAPRVQRFDFRRVAGPAIERLLTDVAAKEFEQVDADAVLLLATAAQGSLRDALVLLEQALGAGERPVTVAVARGSLGLTDPSILQALVTSLAGADPAGTLRAAAAAFDAGADPRQLFRDVARLARAAELVALGYAEGASVGPDEVALVTDLGAIAPAGLWLRLLELIAEAEMNLRQSVDARMLVEVCLLRALRPPAADGEFSRDGGAGGSCGGVGARRGRRDGARARSEQ